MQKSYPIYLALGSNLGERAANLTHALQALPSFGIEILTVSSFLETEPVGGPPGQGRYLNAVAHAQTQLTPHQVLKAFLQIEKDRGRERSNEVRNAARTLDLDLLFYDNQVLNDPELILPHPRLHQRAFVLEPLKEIAPDLLHPVLKKRIREIHPTP